MIQLEIKEEDRVALQQGRYSQLHPRVMQKYNALWLKHKGFSNSQICEVEGICNNTLLSFFKQYIEGGLERLQEIKFFRPQSEMESYSGKIEQYFEENPPASIGEAVAKIEELTGIKRSETQVRKFLKDRKFRFLRVGTVPAKALTEGKKTNSGNFWSRP
jgi:transposase